MKKYRFVCILTVRDETIHSRDSFEDEIQLFNQANKPQAEVEVVSVTEEKVEQSGV